MQRRSLIISAAVAAATPAIAQAQAADAESLAERLLDAIGGRAAWAAAHNSRNDSQQNRVTEPTVVRAVITLDFRAPRFRIDTTGPGLQLARAVDGERHWRRTRAGVVEPYPADLLEEERRWYAGHVYRTLHRIAARDAAITLQRPQADRLEVFERGARIAWFRLDARGEPYHFGAHGDEAGTLCGPWAFEASGLDAGRGIRHPVWTANRDGTWRAWLRALEVNVAMPQALLDRPPPG
jgi:hypothetical protein